MNLRQAIEKAVDTRNARLAGKIADIYRFKFGATYQEILERFQLYRPAVTPAFFESLMYEADWEETSNL